MKPIYRCDYCTQMGTEEEMKLHEEKCPKNFNNKSCLTCKNCKTDGIKKLECVHGVEIPEGKQCIHCARHEKGKPEVVGFGKYFMDILGGSEYEG